MILLCSLSALANPFLTEGVVWKASSEWSDTSALPQELESLRRLQAEAPGWPLVYTDAVSSRAAMRGPYASTNGDLVGVLGFMERSNLTLDPRQEGWWAEPWITQDTEDGYALRQQGMVRHHQGDGLEAIAVESRRWHITNTPMYSSSKYEEHVIMEESIIVYRGERAVAFYQRETNLETAPRYTDQQWKARTLTKPEWATLPTHPDVRITETAQIFSYSEDGILLQIDAYTLIPSARVRHRVYTPHPSQP